MKSKDALLWFFFLLPAAAFAGSLEDGRTAFDRRDYQSAMKLLQPLADQGNAEAQYEIGVMYEHGWGGVKQDYAEAMKWFRKSANQGFSWGQKQLGEMYTEGLGVPPNPQEGEKWGTLAVAPGNTLGNYYYVQPPPRPYVPTKEGAIPNQAVAVQVAEAILKPIFGESKIKREEPFKATLENDIWSVCGSLPENTVGGAAQIQLSKSDGRVISIISGE